jgi:hypothetical protein
LHYRKGLEVLSHDNRAHDVGLAGLSQLRGDCSADVRAIQGLSSCPILRGLKTGRAGAVCINGGLLDKSHITHAKVEF